MNIDFVKVPFSNNPSMSRYEGQIFNKNPSKIYLLEKQKQLNKFGVTAYMVRQKFRLIMNYF